MPSPNAERFRRQRAIYSALVAVVVGVLAFTLPLEHLSAVEQRERDLLPTDAVPTHYTVLLAPNLETFRFDGHETIELQVRKTTSRIVLHSLDTDVDADSVSVQFGESESLKASSVTKPNKETLLIEFPSELPLGVARLSLSFVGNLNDLMCGFYRSKYTVNGVQKWMATTQFEAPDARRAFPCFDEPAHKATFGISLRIDENLSALGNMPIETETRDAAFPGTKTITFAKSPIMSTYLVAFVVGEFDFVETTTNHGVKMRVYTPPGKSEQGTFALQVGSKTLDYFTDYFALPYPLPKMDMIAIADFSAGAMENWGLVTYRETALLIDAEKSGISSKQRVAYVVAHELAHQWFGNLVTMEWWKELWLNEGFATFIGNQAVDHLFPEWNIWTQFVNDYVARAQDLDGLQSSHPIEVEIYKTEEINEIFDMISYAKGACVIRMVSNFLGEKNFQKGLQIYLDRHKYGNAVTEDLWRALSEASNLDVSVFMNKWTKRMGYPLLQISSVEGSNNKFAVRQSRFLSSGAVVESETWWNSVGFISSKSPNTPFYVDVKEEEQIVELPAELVDESEWIKANAMQFGFFRVGYDEVLLSKLVSAIRSNAIGPIDRMTIQSDAFALAGAGKQSTAQALQIASAFANEADFTVWNGLITNLGTVSSIWAEEPCSPRLDAFIRSLLRPVAARLGWESIPGESDRDALLRALIISQLGLYKDEETIAEGKKRFEEHVAGGKQIPVDLRFAVYRMVVMSGGESEWEAVKGIFETSDMNEEKLRALRALGFTTVPELKIKTLEYTLNNVRPQDVAFGIQSVASSSVEGRQGAWKFFQDNFDTFVSKFGEGQFLLPRIIGYVTSGFVTDADADLIEAFFVAHPTPTADRTIKQSLEAVRSNAAWLVRDRQAVSAFLLGFDA